MNENHNLTTFSSPFITFHLVQYNDKEEFSIELGEDFIDETDEMTDEQIRDWAENNGYFDEEYDYIDEDGYIDFDRLRDHKKNQEEDYPANDSYPSGRAYEWFNKLSIEFPNEIRISLVDGDSPGNDWRGVIVEGHDSIKKLQEFLFNNKVKANFIFEYN